ncbi:hypothetical protein CYMTET_39658 [Cymbomonas tetramitiformis]|uniref:Uncharacterized protein n=1 Tax=Cymbomonas tetramitiformis TaxID=36881 RepID=A0AAE0CBW3_9CHLO|nr:hypothetical protein CYMTET_39658 [Cymbomonas tetramitiformis]
MFRLALLVAVFWAGVRDTFDFDDVFEYPSPLRSLSSSPLLTITLFPLPHPTARLRTTSPLAFQSMGMLTRAKKSLDRDSDIDASLRLLDGVRNNPTVRTPTVPTPAPTSSEDANVATRKYLQEQSRLVDDIYTARLHRQWAKGIREDVLGDKKHHFRGTDDAGLLSELVVQLRTEFHSAGLEMASFDLDDPLARVVAKVNGLLYDVLALVVEKHNNAYVWLTGTDASSDRDGRRALVDIIKGCVSVALRESHQEEHAALRYPADTDPQPILAREQRLVRVCGITKLRTGRPPRRPGSSSLYNRLDPVFYTAVKVRYPLAADLAHVSLASLRSLVVEIYQAWAQTETGKAVSGKSGISAQLSSTEYGALLDKINELQALLRQQRGTDAPPAQQQRQQPQRQQRQQPQRQQRQQPQRGAQWGFRVGTHPLPAVGFDRDDQKARPFCGRCKKAGKAFCTPIDEEDAEGVRALAMCALFQQAADDGAEAFASAASTYGPPAVLCAGAVGGIDVSAYGFTVEPQQLADEPAGDDIHQRLDDLAAEVHAAANCKVHYTHAFFPPRAVLEPHASALVCGPAAAGNMPEEQVPAGGAAASASAVPAPAMPVSQVEDVMPVPLQSARVTATTDGEFPGFVQTVKCQPRRHRAG